MLTSPAMRFISCLSLMLLVAGISPNHSPAQISSPADKFDANRLQSRIYSAIDRALPAVVAIQERNGGGTFSGVIVSPEGHVLSAGHAIRPGRTYRILLSDGRKFQATGMGSNDSTDCALAKIANTNGLPYAEMADSSKLVPNQPCLSISHPGMYDATRGPVIRFGHIINSVTSNRGMIQSTALMEPGDSGGPLFDLNAKVIAIHSRIGRTMDRNYDVPINTFKEYWNQLNTKESFRVSRTQGLPKLGFSAERTPKRDGVLAIEVDAGGIAQKAGLIANDVITKIQDTRVTSTGQFREQLIKARQQNKNKVSITIRRQNENKELTLDFKQVDSGNLQIKGVAKTIVPPPAGIEELSDLPDQFEKVESQLDDNCVYVKSRVGENEISVLATLLANSSDMITKSSRVGNSPSISLDGETIDLKVVARDSKTDLVLLRSPMKNRAGVDVNRPPAQLPTLGRFLLSPDPDGPGLVSVWSTRQFKSRKSESKGFLGIQMSPQQSADGVLIDTVVADGAARRAGLKRGDVIIRMDDTVIKQRNDLLSFLKSVDPNRTITAKIRRDKEELEKEITLGAPPRSNNHVAEVMDKSGRRDGFEQVISHDANLQPRECGGPLYDIYGNFVGLNIARNSRVRSYALPPNVIQSFLQQTQSR